MAGSTMIFKYQHPTAYWDAGDLDWFDMVTFQMYEWKILFHCFVFVFPCDNTGSTKEEENAEKLKKNIKMQFTTEQAAHWLQVCFSNAG